MDEPNNKPHFRFYPGAYRRTGPFSEDVSTCDVCNRANARLYSGVIYSAADERPSVCACCIADGRLEEYFGDTPFEMHDAELLNTTADIAAELLRRTPGVASFNAFEWPVLDGMPLAFIGYGNEKEVWSNPKAVSAMRAAWRSIYEEELETETPYLLVFKEIDGSRICSIVDLD